MDKGLQLWILWVLATAIGMSTAHLGTAIGPFADIVQTGFASLACGGIATGILQWLVLREWLAGANWWVAANVLAVAIVGLFIVAGTQLINVDVGWVGGVLLFGAVAGTLQWFVLRPHCGQGKTWIAVNAIGWGASVPAMGFVGSLVGDPFGGWLSIGVLYGAITGFLLSRMLRTVSD